MDDKHRIILDATRRLLIRYGLHGTSMSMIVKESGIPTGTIYRYFKDKDSLITELHKDLLHQISQYICKDLSSELPLHAQLEILINNVIACDAAYPDRFIIKAMLSMLPCPKTEICEDVASFFLPLSNFIQRGIDESVFKPLPIEILLCLALGPIEWYFQVHKEKRPFLELSAEQRALFIQACWEALTINPHSALRG